MLEGFNLSVLKQHKYLLIPLVLYVFFSVILLTRDPFIYTDEVAFSASAQRMYNSHLYGAVPFENHYTTVGKYMSTIYGPVFPATAGFFYQLFGFNVYTVRLFSVTMCFLSLLVVYLLLFFFTKDSALSSLGVGLLAVDVNFLRTARFVRTDPVVVFFTLVSLYYYVRNQDNLTPKTFAILAILTSLSLFSHFLLGSSVVIIIGLHVLYKHRTVRKVRNLALCMGLPLMLLVGGWFLYSASRSDLNVFGSESIFTARLVPDWHIFRTMIQDRLTFKGISFIGYVLYFLFFIARIQGKRYMKSFWILAATVNIAVVAYGSVTFYAGVISVLALPLVALVLHQEKEKKTTLFNVLIYIITCFGLLSIYQQFKLLSVTDNYSYTRVGEEVSRCIPEGDHNVYFINITTHDPYFYLATYRPDLRLAYQDFHDYDHGVELARDIEKVDYLISYGAYVIAFDERVTDTIIKDVGLIPHTAQLLKERVVTGCTVGEGPSGLPVLAVFGLKR